MINGMTVDEINAQEKYRASVVAKLNGFVPYDDGDTEDKLLAEFERLHGRPFGTRSQEMEHRLERQRAEREAKAKAQHDAELQLIADAKYNGFMDCVDVARELYGSGYKWMASLHAIDEAGEDLVILVPDGHTGNRKYKIPLSRRKGVYRDAFDRVRTYVDLVETQRRWDEYHRNYDHMLAQGAPVDEILRMIGDTPPAPDPLALQNAAARRSARDRAERDARRDKIHSALNPWTGGINRKRHLPRIRQVRKATGIRNITWAEIEELWDPAEVIIS